ncbi:hypothetical protein GCM10009067_09620 [Haloarcula sebkhae]|uniref:Small CPxCG-related zinc finger protein n=1 Tax=Haloarcula sebkhae TaxID=932660 RepID=A0A830EP92_9EURY|nr:hypothetical protein GCM10009067_09620 [Haloarcula sebkhae]
MTANTNNIPGVTGGSDTSVPCGASDKRMGRLRAWASAHTLLRRPTFIPVRAELVTMSLFNDLGRKVEELKQEVGNATDDEATHRCIECDTLLYTDHDECPECGSTSVIPLSD